MAAAVVRRPVVIEQPSARTIDVADPGQRLVEDIAREVDRLGVVADRVDGLLHEVRTVAGRELAGASLGEVARAVDRLVIQRYQWWMCGYGVLIVLALGAGAALDRWVLPAGNVPVAVICEPHQPGQVFNCTMQMRGD